MRQHRATGSHPHGAADTEQSIANRNRQIAEQDPEPQAMITATRPARRNDGSHQRPDPAPGEQNAHAEHGTARGVDAVSMYGKLTGSHHGEDDPAWANHNLSSLGEDRRKQGGMIADIANALEYRREIHQIARPERSGSLRVRFGKMHSRN